MDQWEYKIIDQHRRTTGLQPILYQVMWEPEIDFEKLGEKGWELAAVAPMSTARSSGVTNVMRHYFKRKISPY